MPDVKNKLFNQNLVTRVLSALVLIPLVLAAVWTGGWAFNGLVMLISILGMGEWLRLTASMMPLRGRIVSCACVGAVLLAAIFYGIFDAFILSFFAMLLVGYYTFASEKEDEPCRLCHGVIGALGIPYLTWSAMELINIRAQSERGLFLIVFLLLVVWGTDTGAYFAGRIIGGPKLLPKISPKKTWAGLVGGMALAAGLGYACARFFGESGEFDGRGELAYGFLGLWLAIVAQAGDFWESYVKRRAGAKDSGTLIPGHGGVLDRVDGLLAVALFLFLAGYFLTLVPSPDAELF